MFILGHVLVFLPSNPMARQKEFSIRPSSVSYVGYAVALCYKPEGRRLETR
jgi:hypothetical protein